MTVIVADEPLDNLHSSNMDPHWRLYLSLEGVPCAVCVQANDYLDYHGVRFLTGHAYEAENDALVDLNRILTAKAALGSPADRMAAVVLVKAGAPVTRAQCLDAFLARALPCQATEETPAPMKGAQE